MGLLLSACTTSGPSPSGQPTPLPNPPGTADAGTPLGSLLPTSTPQPTRTPPPTIAVPPVQDGEHTRGPADAKTTFVIYGDFQCPVCAALAGQLPRLLKDHESEVRIVFRHFPLPNHDKAAITAEAAEAAAAQGKFWEMHDLLFKRQADWANLSGDAFRAELTSYATRVGLDIERFNRELDQGTYRDKVKQALDAATQLGLKGTPTVFVNGRQWPGMTPFDYFFLDATVKIEAIRDRQFKEPPPVAIDANKSYTATIATPKGEIVIALDAKAAPEAVNNFVFLARNGWYDDITFHKVITTVAAYAGDPTGTTAGAPGYFVQVAQPSELRFDQPGLVAMDTINSRYFGSQFFITYAPQPQFNGKQIIFGRVVSGMEVLRELTPRDPTKNVDAPPGLAITAIRISEG
jgi:cyclophilin family peptidyl-prolyl cis-trans isomerase/protein-disulfide isomerase